VVEAGSKYNQTGERAQCDLTAIVENSRLKRYEKVNAQRPQPSGYVWALSGINLRRQRIDPVADGWHVAFGRAADVLAEDWLPVLDRFDGPDWLAKCQSLRDSDIPWPGSAMELLLGDGDQQAAKSHLEWIRSITPQVLESAAKDIARGPASPGTVRASVGFQIADVLRRHGCASLLDAE
jgi:hypothetical protein